MTLLLDSNAVVYWLNAPKELSAIALVEIENAAVVYVSVATVWELEIKRAAGQLSLPGGFWEALENDGITVLAIDRQDAMQAARLPLHHRDPFDRMIVGQAIGRDLSLVTRDAALAAYGVRLIAT